MSLSSRPLIPRDMNDNIVNDHGNLSPGHLVEMITGSQVQALAGRHT